MASELAYEASDEASENELLDKSLSVWRGWNPSVIDKDDFSPVRIDIHTASSIGQYESVRSLINKGEVDIDKRNRGGWTPLMYACYIGHEAIAKLLIDAECDINMKNNKGQTPLMLAASCGNEAVGHLLVKHEAELESLDKKGWTALFHATNSGHQNFVRFLLTSGANMDAVVPCSGVTPLMEAAAEGHEIIVQLFLQFGVNVNAKTYNGDMARSVALINGYMKIVSLIDNHLMPLSIRSGPADCSSSDEAVRRPRPQNMRGVKMKIKSGPSIRDGPDAIARLIDRSKPSNTSHQLTVEACVPKGYVTFPQNTGEQNDETQLSYRDVTSPINPEDYTLDSSGGKESYENEEDSNAFSKTGAITIKSSSSSSGGLVAALGLSRDNSLESDDFPPPCQHTNNLHRNISQGIQQNHYGNSMYGGVPIATLTPSSSGEDEIDQKHVTNDNQTILTPFNPHQRLETIMGNHSKLKQFSSAPSSESKYDSVQDNLNAVRENLKVHCDNIEEIKTCPVSADLQLETNYRSLVSAFDNHLNSENIWKSQMGHIRTDMAYSPDTRDSGISTNDTEDYSVAANPLTTGISASLVVDNYSLPHDTTVNKHPSVLSNTIADNILGVDSAATETVQNIHTVVASSNMSDVIPGDPIIPPLATGMFPGQPIIPPSYPQDLASLLEKHGLCKYLPIFEEQDVDLTVFLSLTDNDLKEVGIKLFGPRKKMTNAIARWHSNAPLSATGLERAYADRLEGEMQEMAIQLNQTYNNVEKLKAQIQQEKQLRSVTEGCLLEQQEAWQNIHHIVIDTKKRCDGMKDKVKKVRVCLNDLKESMVKNHCSGKPEHSTVETHSSKIPSINNTKESKSGTSCSVDFTFSKLDKYIKELSQNIAMVTMNCDHISDKCVKSREVDQSFS
ncbi:ankyrin repeat and SAM domain-containing protein 3 [Patella vulgata]|uniref:ankyrin repeat and SAM domain-containing protein 3 n=1 Tax=Patella vulgata TaxID=6465 RepID=UPI0024A8392D|nr:ankyrin repeat and SAM domain-containing protein 3 [Patella vulgata]